MDSLSFLTSKTGNMVTDEEPDENTICALLADLTEEQQRFITSVGHGHCHALIFLLAFLEYWTNDTDMPPANLRKAVESTVKAMSTAIELDSLKHSLPFDVEAFYV